MKKILLFLLAVLGFTLPLRAQRANVYSVYTGSREMYFKVLVGNEVAVTYSRTGTTSQPWSEYDYNKPSGDIVIPERVRIFFGEALGEQEYTVTAIDEYAFKGCYITSVSIPNTVTSIGQHAFEGCRELYSVSLPNSVTTIGDYAFYNMHSGYGNDPLVITLGNGITSIGQYAFEESGFTALNVTLPSTLTTIGSRAFYDCNITNVNVPSTVGTIGSGAFYGTFNLIYSGSAIDNGYHWGAQYRNAYLEGDLLYVDNTKTTLLKCLDQNVTSVIIPNSVTTIGDGAFKSCSSLTSVTIGNSVATIGEEAFYGCNLTSVTIPNSVTAIGYYAFAYSGLSRISVPESVTTIGYYAFGGVNMVDYCGSATGNPWGATRAGCFCADGDFIFEDNTKANLLVYLGNDASVTIPNSVTTISDRAFYNCSSLTSVTIPESVTTIGYASFSGCNNLTSVIIPNSVTSMGVHAFSYCSSLQNVTIGNSVTSIGDQVFFNCSSLQSAVIPNSVTSIGYSAFSNCTSLTSVTIGKSVTSIGTYAFSGCSGLTSVVFNATNCTSMGSDYSLVFDNCNNFSNLTIGEGVTTIPRSAFRGCNHLTSVIIPNTVTSIGYYAFYECSGLQNVTIGNSVVSIGQQAFYYCSNLTSITIPESMTTLDWGVFNGCNRLKTVYNLSALRITKGYDGFGYVAYYADRVIDGNVYTKSGSGKNALYQITNANYSIINSPSNIETNIPESTIPYNFIYNGGSGWKAKKVVLSDGADAFNAPVDFTAETVEFDRSFYTDRPSTVCLPFVTTTAQRTNFKLYDFSSYENGTAGFTQVSDNSTANRPYIIEYNPAKDDYFQMPTLTNVQFSETPNAMPVVTYNSFNFVGTLQQASMSGVANRHYYGLYYGYFVEGGSGSNAAATVNPFRSYFYTDGTSAARPTGVDLQNEGEVGIELVDPEMSIQYSNDVYDLMGRCVRKNADNLRGLPKGIYIWKGKKMLNY